MELQEAQLFRLLTGLFGEDQVLFDLSAAMVCRSCVTASSYVNGIDWDKLKNYLFTIVDHDDIPQLVIEFAVSPHEYVDVEALERQNYLLSVLSHHGVKYVLLTKRDLHEILDPSNSLSGAGFLLRKIEEGEGA